MIRSMTGYGRAEVHTLLGRFTVEMRSVNHRFGEILVRLPRDLAALEDRVRAVVQERVLRGRVEVTILREDRAPRPRSVRADLELAAAYAQALRELAAALGVPNAVSLAQIAAYPDVLRVEETKDDLEALWPDLATAVRAAAADLVEMREAEGRRLAQDLETRLSRLEELGVVVERRSRDAVGEYAARLRERIRQLLGEVPVDEHRLAAEVAIFAERSDVSEEVTRLRSHIAQFRQELARAEGAVGRRLEFVLQEMGREVNTTGAKANDLEITRAVIAMKGELESMREQIQNVE
ncbi:MAG: YicC/YloC family endoribonuclease [Armatimonadota bacterium]|nr:YicC/YloC family endoribonuclease [Armatimonadota bacterium]MDR7451786.1 YicC/YloC family endoribonuclease [Armatimonadota bacterium]MDR7467411.1 YicC/YloC family endoribonuclease [Armatimonadota bacterium]MDR7494181.1 YicC/YloC family endoribonuclease [Armatimonadota bacterium]MDR7498853.1 YicC/YloC family endoribonuclease [Armatimonadota bacterium]